ncbi:MAG: tRNA (adenosine(37)-N6)-threonylcarbamoyltransferase complex ATPase subunit type 1 TsaE [Treponemataceae bacterium]|nr:MAG: tRNA (adenosine(37)-N6)-threonylcarbamoyltransferase complex ATPase subunit type 1 TsaE [Treponemataceae bacterium]
MPDTHSFPIKSLKSADSLKSITAKTYSTHSREETIALGKRIGERLTPGAVIALFGTLAAGKTTFTKGIALSLGITEEITSPTFTIISEYCGKKMPLYHMDMYRLTGVNDFIDLGADDMLYGNGVCVIEWSEKIIDELPANRITILLEIEPENPEARRITVTGIELPDFADADMEGRT